MLSLLWPEKAAAALELPRFHHGRDGEPQLAVSYFASGQRGCMQAPPGLN